jgi:hypothetical protein
MIIENIETGTGYFAALNDGDLFIHMGRACFKATSKKGKTKVYDFLTGRRIHGLWNSIDVVKSATIRASE